MVSIVKHFRVFGTSLLLILASALFQVVYYAAARIIFPGDDIVRIESPLIFLHGPLSYFLYLTAAGLKRSLREKVKHLIPFAVMLGGYILLLSKSVLHHHSLREGFVWYNQWAGLAIVSLVIYLITISLSNRNQPMLHHSMQRFLGQLNILYLFIALMQLVGIIQLHMPSFHMGINTLEVQYALLLVVALFSIREIIAAKRRPVESSALELFESVAEKQVQTLAGAGSYHKSALDETTQHHYAVKIQCFLEESKLYLDPDLSLEKLANKAGIPRHHLSQLLSGFFGNSFYQFIAGHRIVYAMQLLRNSQENLTLESFARQCGFNSKTSFNRYFKEYVGCTPSGYRAKMIAANDIKRRAAANA